MSSSRDSDVAAELGVQIAQLAKSALPLAPGLRAMADELPRGRVSHTLDRIAAHLETGQTLEVALEAEGRRFPAHVRQLILAGARSGRLPLVLEQFVRIERSRGDLRRRVWLVMAYPLLLLAMVAALYVFYITAIVPPIVQVVHDFEGRLPAVTELLIVMAGPAHWAIVGVVVSLALVIALVCLLPRPVWVRRVFYLVPLVGPVWKYAGLVEFSRLMHLLLDQEVPLPEALRLTAEGMRTADLAVACRGVAAQVEAGQALADSLSRYWQFPAGLGPLVRWAQQTPRLAEAFQAAAETFEARVRAQMAMLEAVAPPLVFLAIIASVLSLNRAVLLPMVSLINSLMCF